MLSRNDTLNTSNGQKSEFLQPYTQETNTKDNVELKVYRCKRTLHTKKSKREQAKLVRRCVQVVETRDGRRGAKYNKQLKDYQNIRQQIDTKCISTRVCMFSL